MWFGCAASSSCCRRRCRHRRMFAYHSVIVCMRLCTLCTRSNGRALFFTISQCLESTHSLFDLYMFIMILLRVSDSHSALLQYYFHFLFSVTVNTVTIQSLLFKLGLWWAASSDHNRYVTQSHRFHFRESVFVLTKLLARTIWNMWSFSMKINKSKNSWEN